MFTKSEENNSKRPRRNNLSHVDSPKLQMTVKSIAESIGATVTIVDTHPQQSQRTPHSNEICKSNDYEYTSSKNNGRAKRKSKNMNKNKNKNSSDNDNSTMTTMNRSWSTDSAQHRARVRTANANHNNNNKRRLSAFAADCRIPGGSPSSSSGGSSSGSLRGNYHAELVVSKNEHLSKLEDKLIQAEKDIGKFKLKLEEECKQLSRKNKELHMQILDYKQQQEKCKEKKRASKSAVRRGQSKLTLGSGVDSINDDDDDDDGEKNGCERKQTLQFFHDDYYGQNEFIVTPFSLDKSSNMGNGIGKGLNLNGVNYEIPIMYCDWTASGKSLKSIENYIDDNVRVLYANTHTATSVTGKQTTLFRNEARDIILKSASIGGNKNDDVIIFCGNGVTGAIYKMAHILSKTPNFDAQKTIVFVGVYEHNSNIYIWQELGIKVVVIPEYTDMFSDSNLEQDEKKEDDAVSSARTVNNSTSGSRKYGINSEILEKYLIEYTKDNNYNLIIGSFSAASNVSGIIEKDSEITQLLHKYNALSFWDYATAGPYLNVNFSVDNNKILSKDAVFLSPHKFLGGPGTPGVLICKRSLCKNSVPVVPGGGTVLFAFGTKNGEYKYHKHIEEREEGGTPNIIGSIRAALAFMAKDKISVRTIEDIEHYYIKTFLNEMKEYIDKNVFRIIGNSKCPRVAIISFNIEYNGKFLHYNYVAALLNDLFGIQGRGGCSCAGMYGYEMLKLQRKFDVAYMTREIMNENELARIGYYRINLHYTLTKEEFEYIIRCVKFVCEHGWKFLALYSIDIKSGLYVHRRQLQQRAKTKDNGFKSLKQLKFNNNNNNKSNSNNRCNKCTCKTNSNVKTKRIKNLNKVFDFANDILQNMKKFVPSKEELIREENHLDDGDSQNRWYWLPSDLYDSIAAI